MSRSATSEHVASELLGARAVVDDRPAALAARHAPVVDRLAVVADDVTVTGSVGASLAAVVELEPITATGGTGHDLDLLALEPSVSHDETST